jgi:cytochrome P450
MAEAPISNGPSSDVAAVDFFSDSSVLEDPFSYYEFVRAHGPVWREPFHEAFVVTGYDEISAIYRDSDTFSSCSSFGGPFARLPEEGDGLDVSELIERYRRILPNGESFITFDPPEHTAHRGLMMRLLTPKRLQENEAFMARQADTLIDGFIERGSCEFLGEYAQPLALLVIAELLGVPEEDFGALRAAFVANGTPGAVGEHSEAVDFLGFLEGWFTGYIEDRRRRPGDDVLTRMAEATFPDGSLPEVAEVVRVATLLFAGGQGTAARGLGNAVWFLAEHPEMQQTLRDDRSLIPQFMEELLRYNSPVKVNFRMARLATTLAGVPIPAGSNLILLLSAADRDERRFACPAEFDLGRGNAREHVAFGRGVHSCPGGPLVRTEARITLGRLLDRMRDIRISESHHGPAGARRFDYTPSFILRGVEQLHLEFSARA